MALSTLLLVGKLAAGVVLFGVVPAPLLSASPDDDVPLAVAAGRFEGRGDKLGPSAVGSAGAAEIPAVGILTFRCGSADGEPDSPLVPGSDAWGEWTLGVVGLLLEFVGDDVAPELVDAPA